MAFTQAELDNISAATIEYYFKGQALPQNIQDKPLLNSLLENKETLGGSEKLTHSVAVKDVGGVTMDGIDSSDESTPLSFTNPTNNKRAVWKLKDHFAGIKMTRQELLENGIQVIGQTLEKTVVSKDDKARLINLLKDKTEELVEGIADSNQKRAWDDGTTDPAGFAGIRSIIVDDPTTAVTVGGIDQSTNPSWRNWSNLGIVANANNAGDGVLVRALNADFRQMKRYSSGHKYKFFAGSDFIDQVNNERYAKGIFTQSGFSDSQDVSQADFKFNGIPVMYDPYLDDLGFEKRCYLIDMNAIKFKTLEGEFMKVHTPEGEHDKFVFYKGVSLVGGLSCNRRNSSGVFSIA